MTNRRTYFYRLGYFRLDANKFRDARFISS